MKSSSSSNKPEFVDKPHLVYIPAQGDIIWINFDPQVGHEQANYRTAIVISPKSYNKLPSKLVIVCPITNQIKDYPFEVKLLDNMKTTGVVLCDQIKSFDFMGRKGKFYEKAPQEVKTIPIINYSLSIYF